MDAERDDRVVAYGTWMHRQVELWDHPPETAIGIEWFGVDIAYQGQRTVDDESIAKTLFSTIEMRAREDTNSTPDMPLVLEVDEENTVAQGFWTHLGFEYLDTVVVEPPRRQYLRMFRAPSMPS